MVEASSSHNGHTPETQNVFQPNSPQDNPFFLQSSDIPGMKLVSESFDGIGFSKWKRSMSIAL